MLLGKLTAKSHSAVSKSLVQFLQGTNQVMGCLIKDDGAGFVFQLFQNAFLSFLSGGKKASNANLRVESPDRVRAVMHAAGLEAKLLQFRHRNT